MKKFRIAKAGQTTDGREITLEQIKQMAAGYSPAKYGARLNIEHILSVSPSSEFCAYGDVTSLSVEVDGADTYLVAEIDPTPELIALSKKRQKVYFSIEIDPKFAGTGEAYLMAVACTDSPASLGTSYMKFCQQNPQDNPLTARKQKPDNLFSSSELSGEFEAEPEPTPSVMDEIKKFFKSMVPEATPPEKPAKEPEVAQLPDLSQAFSIIAKSQDDTNKAIAKFSAQVTELTEKLSAQQAILDKIPDPQNKFRAPATGGNAKNQTDC